MNIQWTFFLTEVRYYMIDFRAAYKLNCDKITRKRQDNQDIPIQKYLQLTVNARKKLRDKIAAYYSRIPEDDEILLMN